MNYQYIKVSKPIAAALGLLNYRKEMRDGTILLNQKDVMNGDGGSLEEKATLIGGTIITEEEALQDAEQSEQSEQLRKEVENGESKPSK